MSLLADKTILITAATSGLGAALTRAVARQGAAVGIHYRNDSAGAVELAAEIDMSGGRAATAHAELTDPDDVQQMVEHLTAELGPFDALVNNASIYLPPKPAHAVPWQDFQAEFEGSLKTSVLCAQAVLPAMLERGSGTIVNIVGTMVQRPASGYSAHIAGKGALLAWSRTLAKELAPAGIRVHCISPGMALTPNVLAGTTESEREDLRRKTPSRALAQPDDIANLAVFLISDLAVSETGLHLNADGGLAELGG